MKESLLIQARHNKQTDASVLALLDGLSREACEDDRPCYYHSLSGLARHLLDGTNYFQGLFRASLPVGLAKTLAAVAGAGGDFPEGPLDAAGWAKLKAAIATTDQATIDLIRGLDESGCSFPIKLDWYEGKPDAVPFHFLAQQLFEHGTHHRGQISQILDELGVEHDFSGIALECLSE
jgi:uncharacterized damage-inducible protein DinB